MLSPRFTSRTPTLAQQRRPAVLARAPRSIALRPRPSAVSERTPHEKWIYAFRPSAGPEDPDATPDKATRAESAVLKGRAVLDQLAGALAGPRPKGVTKTKLRAAAEEELWAIAWYEGYTSGKWLVQCPEASVDEAWASIAAAVEDGQLGSAAKVATQPLHGGHTACIYMERFDDIEGVRQVYETLKGLGLGPGPNSFKLDLCCAEGNAWGLPVSVFTPKTLYSEEQAKRIRRACGRR